MPDKALLLAQIENAADMITPFWPLKTFIAANPIAGLENLPFAQAITQAHALYGAYALPTRAQGQAALKTDSIDEAVLQAVLKKNKAEDRLTAMLHGPAADKPKPAPISSSALHTALLKYLAAFLDEGQAAWPMPGRERGFFTAWREIAVHDETLPNREKIRDYPEKSIETLLHLLNPIATEDRETLLRAHMLALPGWAGFIKWRARQKTYPWQKAYPITLADYLAVRLILARLLEDDGLRAPETTQVDISEGLFWLQAWEETYRARLVQNLSARPAENDTQTPRPEAQFVFCIDVRSEVFRRHLESRGAYETFGFAGFFGIAIRHHSFGADLPVDSCPVLLQPQFDTTEKPCCGHESEAAAALKRGKALSGLRGSLGRLKSDIAGAFSTVEATGAFYGAGLALHTFRPLALQRTVSTALGRLIPVPKLAPTIAKTEDDTHGFSLAERLFHAEAALKIMGLTRNFAPFILLTGHGSETINNPYAAGLDCGACGGNQGGPNARVMAAILNDPQVREGLKPRGLDIPSDTLFLAAQHNTTTDSVTLYNPPDAMPKGLQRVIDDLAAAQTLANAERALKLPTPQNPAHRAADWAQVRPEWGLARNATFIIAPRSATKGLNLEGRSFLHSYNWEEDTDGKALTIILTAPMVVAQWINSQYYFSTLDNTAFGSGSKITQNVVGKIGVMQGNTSDLLPGLPLQSIASADGTLYHEPLRLLTYVSAPLARVSTIIAEQDILQKLFDHEWVALCVQDPHTHKLMCYRPGRLWQDWNEAESMTPAPSRPEKDGAIRAAENTI